MTAGTAGCLNNRCMTVTTGEIVCTGNIVVTLLGRSISPPAASGVTAFAAGNFNDTGVTG